MGPMAVTEAAGAPVDALARSLPADGRGPARSCSHASAGISARTVYDGVGEGGDRDAGDRPRRRGRSCSPSSRRLHAQGRALHRRSPRSAARSLFGDGSEPARVVIDPIDGSLNARRTMPSLRAQHRRRVRADDGRRRVRLRLRLRRRRGVRRRAAATGRTLDGEPLLARRPRFRTRGRRARGGQAGADRCRSSPASRARRIGCARSARSRSRSATSPRRASTACSARAPAARSTSPPPS